MEGKVQHANAAGERGVPASHLLNSPFLEEGVGDGWLKEITDPQIFTWEFFYALRLTYLRSNKKYRRKYK
jgi:hypothetical protein